MPEGLGRENRPAALIRLGAISTLVLKDTPKAARNCSTIGGRRL